MDNKTTQTFEGVEQIQSTGHILLLQFSEEPGDNTTIPCDELIVEGDLISNHLVFFNYLSLKPESNVKVQTYYEGGNIVELTFQ